MSLEQEKSYARYLLESLYNPRVDLIKVRGSFATYFSRPRIPHLGEISLAARLFDSPQCTQGIFVTFHYICCQSILPNYVDAICRKGCLALNQNLRKY